MGIAKTFKSLFKNRKKKENEEIVRNGAVSPKSKPRNQVNRNKSLRSGIYEPYRNHFPLRQNAIPMDKSSLNHPQNSRSPPGDDSDYSNLPYGAYNPSKGKLITANGEFNPGNYEYFDPLKRQTQDNTNRNSQTNVGNMYASNESISSNVQQIYQQQILRNSQMRSSTRSLDQFGQTGQNAMIKNSPQRMSMRSVGTGSLTNIAQAAQPQVHQSYGAYQDWNFNPIQNQPPQRPTSVDPYQMMGQQRPQIPHFQMMQQNGSHQNGSHQNPYMYMPDMATLTGLKFDPSGAPETQNPYEIAAAVRKMEQCLQMLNSLQQQQNTAKAMGANASVRNNSTGNIQQANPHQIAQQNSVPQMAQQQRPATVRKTVGLQPQPEFQEREARKKRRLRKKSDLSKFDLSDLRKKLETIDREESTDSGGDTNSGDKGYCEGSDGSSEGIKTPEKQDSELSDSNDSGGSSDSGVATPPPVDAVKLEEKIDEFKPILSMTKGILKRSNSR